MIIFRVSGVPDGVPILVFLSSGFPKGSQLLWGRFREVPKSSKLLFLSFPDARLHQSANAIDLNVKLTSSPSGVFVVQVLPLT